MIIGNYYCIRFCTTHRMPEMYFMTKLFYSYLLVKPSIFPLKVNGMFRQLVANISLIVVWLQWQAGFMIQFHSSLIHHIPYLITIEVNLVIQLVSSCLPPMQARVWHHE